MRKIHSISLTEEQSNWLDRQKDIKLSLICQKEIDNMMAIEKSMIPSVATSMHQERINSLMKTIYQFRDFLEKKQLLDEYLKGDSSKSG